MSTENNSNKEMLEINKNVVMLMPFRSRDKQGRTQSNLENLRIKFIVENLIDIFWRNTQIKINYTVKILLTGAGEVKDVIEDDFEEADLFIALMSEKNVNVIYEIAIVNILQKNIILLLDESPADLPVYFEGYAHIQFYDTDNEGDDREIQRNIKKLSNSDSFVKKFGSKSEPNEIIEFKELITNNDYRLINDLKDAMEKYEHGQIKPPQSFRRLVRDIQPSKALGTWDTYLPTSVLRVDWKPENPETHEYDGPDSLIKSPAVCSCNYSFMRFLGSAKQHTDSFVTEGSLDGAQQMRMLGEYISDENQLWFERDQTRIFEALFLKDKPANAIIPIEFNQTGNRQHPYESFRGKVFLPILVGKKVVGVKTSQHTTYYIILFVEDFFPFDEISENSKQKIQDSISQI